MIDFNSLKNKITMTKDYSKKALDFNIIFFIKDNMIYFEPAGLTFTGRNGQIRKYVLDSKLDVTKEYNVIFQKEPNNKYDKYAISMYVSLGDELIDIGYVPRNPQIDGIDFNKFIYDMIDNIKGTLISLNNKFIVIIEEEESVKVELEDNNDMELFL